MVLGSWSWSASWAHPIESTGAPEAIPPGARMVATRLSNDDIDIDDHGMQKNAADE